MSQKVFELKNKGMMRDLSISKSSNEYAYENMNIRITPLDHDTLLSVTNERGPEKISDITLQGTVIGHCVLNQYLIIFTAGTSDRIYKIELKQDGSWTSTVIYEGHLNFSTEHPVETLALYESEALQKVYWVDGINQPRVININKSYSYSGDSVDTVFDFVTTFKPNTVVDITKSYDGAGNFPSGVIQYYITYFNKYGQETNIVYQSPQYYLSDSNKGASPEDNVNCSFNITISNIDTSFDYIRVYSLIRTSYNTVPQLHIVGDISISQELSDGEALITDNGAYSESLDPTVLLYIGGIEISASTLTQKDNTLFLGDIENLSEIVDTDLKDMIDSFRESSTRNNYLKFESTGADTFNYTIPYYPNNGYYPYSTQLNDSSDRIKTFKGGETYRIGVRFFTATGSSTSVYWLGDVFNPIYPALNGIVYNRAVLRFEFPQDIKTYVASRYNQFQLYMAEATQSDRTVIAQGVLSPTVFNIRQRCNNAPFALSSWFFRFNGGSREYNHYQQLPPMATDISRNEDNEVIDFTSPARPLSVEIQGICENVPVTMENDTQEDSSSILSYEGLTISAEIWNKFGKGKGGYFYATGNGTSRDNEPVNITVFGGKGGVSSGEDCFTTDANEAITSIRVNLSNIGIPMNNLPSRQEFMNLWDHTMNEAGMTTNYPNRKIRYVAKNGGYTPSKSQAVEYSGLGADTPESQRNAFIQKYGNNYYVDSSILTFHSPDITDDNANSLEDYHIRIIGYAPVTSNISNFDINASAPYNGVKTLYNRNFNTAGGGVPAGVLSYPLWQDYYKERATLYWMYPWHKTGSISKIEKMDMSDPNNPVGTGEYYSILENKTWANLFYCYDTVYKVTASSPEDIGWKNLSDIAVVPQDYVRGIQSDLNASYLFQYNSNSYNYQGDIDSILSFNSEQSYPVFDTGGENASSLENRVETSIYSNATSYDSVNIAFKSSAHALVVFNDITKNGETMKSVLPVPGNMDNEHVLDGDLPWEELTGSDYSYYNLMTYNADYPQFSVQKDGNVYTMVNETSPEDWETLVQPLLDAGDDVYFSYIDDSGDTHIVKIISLEVEKPTLDTPNFTGKIEHEETGEFTLTITITPVANATGYAVEIKNSTDEVLYNQTKPDTTISVTDADHTFKVQVKAVDGDEYNDSSIRQKIISTNNIEFSQLSINMESDDISEYTVTLSSTDPWSIASGGISLLSEEPLSGTEILMVTGTEVSLNEECYFNDIRFGKRWEWDASLQEIVTPKTGSSTYIETHLGWNIDAQYSDYPSIYIAELYKDYDSATAYGGQTEYALKNNTFIPISRRYSLNGGNLYYGVEGDTYFQRWDCLKTEPYAEDKENSIIELLSFMVETHKNIDGRYDIRRGMMNNLTTTSTNTNLINDVYSQPDNFITGVIFEDDAALTKFPTQITWTKTKTLNEDIDTWTNITLASVLDMDGDKGNITALRRLANSIVCFQDKGIAEILFNSRTQLATTEGIPIELANSGKVDGKRYISEKIGCLNKWSIVETSTGIYFIDNINSSISVFNGSNVQSLSNIKGFKAWMQLNNSTSIWNPVDFDNFIGFYDRANDDIYFINKDTSLCFNEMLNEFTSFYSYNEVPVMATVQNKFIAVKDHSLWGMHEGEYNNYFGEYKPFHITYKVTPDPYADKIFTNIEYKADVFKDDVLQPEITFNTLDVWNEYQQGHLDLDFQTPQLSNLKRKFRNWAAFIPRDMKDNIYGYNRIRNPWIYLKLEMNDNLEDTRMEMHNLLVRYL